MKHGVRVISYPPDKDSMYDQLMHLLIVISTVSIATERAVEIAKPLLPQPNEKYRTMLYSLMSFVVSSIILYVNSISVPLFMGNLYTQAIVIGLACTGSSGVWYDIIKVVQTLKVKSPG